MFPLLALIQNLSYNYALNRVGTLSISRRAGLLQAALRLRQPGAFTRWVAHGVRQFVAENQTYPGPAPPSPRRERPRILVETSVLGLKIRYQRPRPRKPLTPFHSSMPEGGYQPPNMAPRARFYHDHPDWVLVPPGRKAAVTDLWASLAAEFFTPEKAAFVAQPARTGWLDLYTGPPFTQALTANRVEPGGPGTEAINDQILRFASRGLAWVFALPVAGTRVFPLNIVEKTKPDGSVKLRPTAAGNHPAAPPLLSRKSWAPRSAASFSQRNTIDRLAALIRSQMVSAIIFDLENGFEFILKHAAEISSNCYRWDLQEDWPKFVALTAPMMVKVNAARAAKGLPPREMPTSGLGFFYLGGHLFGASGAPKVADDCFGVLEQVHRSEIAKFPGRTIVERIVDDTMILCDKEADQHADEIYAACRDWNDRLGHPHQPTKTKIRDTAPRFDGKVWDLTARRIGLPEDKARRIVALLEGMLARPAAGRLKTTAKSLDGKLQDATAAAPGMHVLTVDFRRCYNAAADGGSVRLCAGARADLQRWKQLFVDADYELSCPWELHFVTGSRLATIVTDASGLPDKGAGRFTVSGTPHFFCSFSWESVLRHRFREFVSDDRVASGFIELVTMFMMVETGRWSEGVIRWVTDSTAAAGAWANGASSPPLLNALIKLISFRFARRAIVVVAEWRSRDSPEIEGADILSRPRIADFLQHSLQFPTRGQFGTADVAPHVRGSANAIYDLCCQRLA